MRALSAVFPLLLVALVAFLFAVPAVDRAVNRTRPAHDLPRPAAPPLAAVDLHTDVLLWDRDLLARARHGHVDLPRLREGNVVVQVFSATNSFPLGANYRRTPPGPDLLTLLAVCNRWPAAAWTSPPRRALVQARVLADAIARSGGRLLPVRTAAELAAVRAADGATGAILAVEGLHGLDGDVTRVDSLFAAGFRVFGLVHMTDTEVAGSAHGWHQGGLTPFGRRVVARIDSLGGMVDLAHASGPTITDVLDTGARRVLVSHAGVDGTCPGNRNLSDAELARIARAGGIVGVGFWKGAVCGSDERAIARAIRHAADVMGVAHVALGSDFDGAVVTPFDAAGIARLAPALAAEGFGAEDIRAIFAGNALRFLEESLPR